MTRTLLQKGIVVLTLGLLIGSAFFMRLDNFKNTDGRTVDGVVYYRMAVQMSENFWNYNTISYGEILADRGRDVPSYFFDPLFKHPPFFTTLMVGCFKLFGISPSSTIIVSLFSSLLLIPLTYLLAQIVFKDWHISLFSSLLVWMDPVLIISSQKVWMDSTIAFLSILAIYFFVHALVRNKPSFFILSGLALGLGVNTKYTAILPLFAFMAYAIIYDRSLFKNVYFRLGLCLPVLMLIPWFLWIWAVYGGAFFTATLMQHTDIVRVIQERIVQPEVIVAFVGIVIIGAYLFIRSSKTQSVQKKPPESVQKFLSVVSILLIGALFYFPLKIHFMRTIAPYYVPFTTWVSGVFNGEPPWFYFGRLLEYSMLYAFAFIGWLRFQPNAEKITAVLRLSILFILLFFIMWGSFQSRYILSIIPLFIIIGVKTIKDCFLWAQKKEDPILRVSYQGILLVIICYALSKTMYINLALSFPNNMCYF